MNILRGLFSRPTTQPDVPSPLDVEDVWGWGGGLWPGARAWLQDQYPAGTVERVEATVRAANEVSRAR